ncbi:MAG: GTPase HflX [Alphaproteobacteria bacterium]|nr:MAG: GTPase HflX [Alphaproteobacteria bacterium]
MISKLNNISNLKEKVLIVIPIINNYKIFKDSFYNRNNLENRKSETISLVSALNINILDVLTIKINKFSSAYLLNKNSLDCILNLIQKLKINLLIIDFQLSPIQQRNLELFFKVKVIDRTQVILEIFSSRAISNEGKIQVELATLNFQKTRLVRSWTHLERQRGGSGFLGGPGERQIELDRRIINKNIKSLNASLQKVVQTRLIQNAKRKNSSSIIVSLVGYTNTGKSTLFNHLTNSSVISKNMLFATLDPTLRLMKHEMSYKKKIILSDTVGFISSLPTELVESFKSTLEFIRESDFLLIVNDASDKNMEDKYDIILNTLKNIGIDDNYLKEKVINVFNKCDLVFDEKQNLYFPNFKNGIFTSSFNIDDIKRLKKKIYEFSLNINNN